jgi:hypothetical protein
VYQEANFTDRVCAGTMPLEWGAHAARVRFSAARRKPRSTIFPAPFREE